MMRCTCRARCIRDIPLTLTRAFDTTSPALVVGLAERDERSVVYNALVALVGGEVQARHRKLYLPTYGMFDEGRFWGRGSALEPWSYRAWRIGMLVCEDFWHPGLAYVLASAGIHVLLVAAAAPGRGVWQGGEDASRFASTVSWQRIAQATAELYGIWVALANRTGVEGGVTFAGGSLIVAPDGSVVAQAGDAETVIAAELSVDALRRARSPYSHARDDDPRLTARLLQALSQ